MSDEPITEAERTARGTSQEGPVLSRAAFRSVSSPHYCDGVCANQAVVIPVVDTPFGWREVPGGWHRGLGLAVPAPELGQKFTYLDVRFGG
ncbi:hypothetical protein ACFO1B_39650 [Dactylosporangium siamense]|uniref:hypothetical protein n=1 Tax=Dactylosporangium siamense TaxID=685454 RepID=UPI00194324C1|nr:hypothetical protein [Dactylosporangium siamense]